MPGPALTPGPALIAVPASRVVKCRPAITGTPVMVSRSGPAGDDGHAHRHERLVGAARPACRPGVRKRSCVAGHLAAGGVRGQAAGGQPTGWLSLVRWLGDVRGRPMGGVAWVVAAPAALEGADH